MISRQYTATVRRVWVETFTLEVTATNLEAALREADRLSDDPEFDWDHVEGQESAVTALADSRGRCVYENNDY